jgi:hypothetical protein
MRLASTPCVKGQAFKLVLWTGSVGLIAVVLRRLFRRRQKDVNVGNVSEDWLAQHRGSSDTASWN